MKSSAAEYEEESTSAEVGSEPADSEPTFFTPPQLPTSAHLTTFASVIPPFGQCHAPVLLTPPAVAGVISQTVAEVVPTTVGDVISVAPTEPISQADVVPVAVSQTVELPAPESEPQIRMDVIDCDAAFTISSSLLVAAELVQTN